MSLLPTLSTASDETQAEVLLWQARYRMLFASLIGLAALTLKWFGVVSAESVLLDRYTTRDLLLTMLAMMTLYIVGHRVLVAYLTRHRRAGLRIVIGAIASDTVIVFSAALFVTPPEHYDRALLISIFTVQFTQVFFGWTATIANLVFISAGYTTLVAIAADAGRLVSPAEELWTLALYGIGVLLYVALQGHVAARMQRLMAIFQRAQEGDFSVKYEEDADQMPDPVSVIGRAYNQMRERLQTIVLTDPLSGCYNRRGLNQLAEREVSRAIRQRKELAVLAIDLDHFKRVNDDYGHLTGDEVIREVGALLRTTAREADVVARFGGEEFTILAPDSSEEGALILADRVMQAFRSYRFRSLPPDVHITVSVGVAADWARDEDVAKTLLARSDEALYVAKRNGRDQAVVWHAGMRAFDGTPPKGRGSVVGMLRINE